MIALRTIIAWPAPDAQNTGAAHGAALGADEVAATKQILGFDPAVSFPAEEEAVAHARQVTDRGKQLHAEWDEALDHLGGGQPGARRAAGPAGRAPAAGRLGQRTAHVPARRQGAWPPGPRPGEVLNALAAVLPELWGGSADLAGSNDTTMKGEPSFIPPEHQTEMFPGTWYRPHAALRHPRARHGRRS